MASLSTKVKLYLESEGKVAQNEFDDENVILQDDGTGVYIKSWNVSGVTKPTEEQLSSLESSATDYESLRIVLSNRQVAYPSVGDQLDMLMKDMRDRTETHQTACEAVKLKYPKPE